MNKYQKFLESSEVKEMIKYYLKNNFKIEINLEHYNPADININFVSTINYFDYGPNSENLTMEEVKETEIFEDMLQEMIINNSVERKLNILSDKFLGLPTSNQKLVELEHEIRKIMIDEYGRNWEKHLENKVKLKFGIF